MLQLWKNCRHMQLRSKLDVSHTILCIAATVRDKFIDSIVLLCMESVTAEPRFNDSINLSKYVIII